MTAQPEIQHTHDAISERAAAFFERRRFGDWSAADQAGLDAWLAESFLHCAAYIRVEGIAVRADQLAVLRRLQRGGRSRTFPFRRLVIPLLAAASIVLAATFEKPIVNYLMQVPESAYSTEIGGRTLLTFADHTQIELNTDTVLHFRITGEERTVWLDKGEAWFHVSHNAANPFNVIVGKLHITDLGTEFLIRRASDRMEVALLTGRATLSAEGTPTTTLTPGDVAVATPASVSVARKTPKELSDALAWRNGMLVFRKTKLADVVREFNRYNTTKLVIADPSIAGEPFTADLKTNDYAAFLNLAQSVLNLRVDHEGNDILISRRHGDETKRAAHSKRSL
jgi:transmembrane sensor